MLAGMDHHHRPGGGDGTGTGNGAGAGTGTSAAVSPAESAAAAAAHMAAASQVAAQVAERRIVDGYRLLHYLQSTDASIRLFGRSGVVLSTYRVLQALSFIGTITSALILWQSLRDAQHAQLSASAAVAAVVAGHNGTATP